MWHLEIIFLVQLCTNTANTTEVHAASAHNLVLLFSHSKMKFAEVKFKRPIVPASMSPRPPETWLPTAFMSPQAATLSPADASLPPTHRQGALLPLPRPRLSHPPCATAASSPRAAVAPPRPPCSAPPALACPLTPRVPGAPAPRAPSVSPRSLPRPPLPCAARPAAGARSWCCACTRDTVCSLWLPKLCFAFIFVSLFL